MSDWTKITQGDLTYIAKAASLTAKLLVSSAVAVRISFERFTWTATWITT
jgi:hypothetical protein